MGNYFNELRWKIIRAEPVLDYTDTYQKGWLFIEQNLKLCFVVSYLHFLYIFYHQ